MFNGYNDFNGYYGGMGRQQFGYPYNNMMQAQAQTNTNKIYVSGIEDVRQRQLPNGSDIIFLDNDKPILYQKIVDSKGQFEVKAFTITPYNAVENDKSNQLNPNPNYLTASDLEPIKAELKAIKDKLYGKDGGVSDGK